MIRRLVPILAAGVAALSACGGTASTTTTPTAAPIAIKLTAAPALAKSDLAALAAAFPDTVFSGGQEAPFVAKMATDSTFMFVEFDRPKVSDATGVAYVGVGVKGTFCSESQPDPRGGSFPVFQQTTAPSWASGLGGKAGAAGYWLSYIAADKLTTGARSVDVGIDYRMPAKPAPSCGTPAPSPAPATPSLTPSAISSLFSVFPENPLQGGQVPPRTYRTLNDQTLAFLQFDHNSAAQAKELRYFGIFRKSTFCQSTQPSRDFTHFHDLVAPTYAQGHGGAPNTVGFWGTWIAAEPFESQGRLVTPGVDRQFSPTPPPSSC